MRHKLILIAGISMLAMMGAQAHAQATGAGAVANKEAGPESTSGFGKEANYTTLEAHQRGGISFIGKVVVQDAMFPWDPIPIVVTCNGVVRYRTEADAKGNFQFVGSKSDPMHSEITPEAADPHEQTASHLIGCDAQASLAGFKSTSVHIANLDIMDNPDIGTITMRPDSDAAGSAMSATTTTANPEAMKRFNKARAEWQNKNIDGAEKDLEKAVQIDPKFADAWYQLGKLQQMKNNPAALNSYQKAVGNDPKFVSPYERIAEEAAMQKKWQDVLNATTQELKLDPAGSPQIWYLDALGKLNTGDADGAEASARKSLAMDPQHLAPNTEQLLAVILASKGQLAEALKHLQNSLTYVKGPNADVIKQQIAQLEKAMPQSPTN
jgi:Tfp pilus assembly protein PilF